MSLPPDKDLDDINDIEEVKAIYKDYEKNGLMVPAVEALDRIAELCLEQNNELQLTKCAHTCFIYLSPDLKLENAVNIYESRTISELTHFFIYMEMRRKTWHQSFSPSRTFMSAHRRRQLAKTMNAEPRTFAFGLNGMYCLGYTTPDLAYLEIPTAIDIPPVYKMRLSCKHSVFWCHDGRFFGAGDGRNFLIKMSFNQMPVLFPQPVELDFKIRKGEFITGFKALENGTLFETNRRWYFIGDYLNARNYLLTLHRTHFHLATDLDPPSDNYWISDDRPTISCLHRKLDDKKNMVPIKILNTIYMIKVYPGYWTELNPGHVKRRPVCYLLDGVEVKDIRIKNVASGRVIWVLHEQILYHGTMTPMLKEGNDGDEMNLDNYIMLIELTEYRTPTPFVVTGMESNNNFGVLIKCGDYPDVGFDHLEMAERRFRGNVHKLMFETIDRYKNYGFTLPNGKYTTCVKDHKKNYTIDYVLYELDIIFRCKQFEWDFTSDWCGRIQKKDRYANYLSFLAYISMARLPGAPPKCFANDIDMMIESENADHVARYRMKQLFEEFERVNYPGTDVWKPVEFLRETSEPETDEFTEGEYRGDATRWAMRTFMREMIKYKQSESYDPEDKVTRVVIKFLLNTVWFVYDCVTLLYNPNQPASPKDDMLIFLKSCDTLILDDEIMFSTMNPGEIFENRKREGIRHEKDLEEPLNITMTFLLRHRNHKYQPTRFKVQTCIRFLMAQNPFLLQYVDNQRVLDLNKVFPDDIKIQRLIAQTYFYGHGYTDLDGCEKYEKPTFAALGLQLEVHQKYLKRATPHFRGVLVSDNDMPGTPMASKKQSSRFDITIETSDGSLIYCHSLIKTLYSTLAPEEPFPSTLSADLMLCALNGLLDRMIFDDLPLRSRIEIAAWYAEARMHEAFMDLLKQCVLDVQSHDALDFRHLVSAYPTQMQRLIAQYRPGIIFWHRSPLPVPRIQHVKIILEMSPKNEVGRHTRFPRKQIQTKTGEVEDTVFRQISVRQLRNLFINEEERRHPRFAEELEEDFPLPYPYKPFKPTGEINSYPTIGTNGPDTPDRRKVIRVAMAAQRIQSLLPPQAAAPSYKPQEMSDERKKMYQPVTVTEERENGVNLSPTKVTNNKKNRRK